MALLLPSYQQARTSRIMYHYAFVDFQPAKEQTPHIVQVHFLVIAVDGQTDFLCTIIGNEDAAWLKHQEFVLRKTDNKRNASYMLSVFPNPLAGDEDIAAFITGLVAAIHERTGQP